MELKWILSAAVVAASVDFSFVDTAASAEVTSFYLTCNSDGYMHSHTFYSNGSYCDVNTEVKCGPQANLPMGGGFKFIFAEKSQISPTAQAFLKRVESSGLAEVKRIPAKSAPSKLSDRAEAIYLKQSDVGPVLARFWTSIEPNWRK